MDGHLQNEWEDFWAHIQPHDGPTEGQQEGMYGAFMAGALVAINALVERDQQRWLTLWREASAALGKHIEAMIARSNGEGE
jgi:hypothetical protein